MQEDFHLFLTFRKPFLQMTIIRRWLFMWMSSSGSSRPNTFLGVVEVDILVWLILTIEGIL